MSSITVDRTETSRDPCLDRLAHLGPDGRFNAYKHGQLNLHELAQWAAHYPEEVPTVNGEIAWLVFSSPDLD